MFLFRSRALHCAFLVLCAALLLFGISSRSPSLVFTTAGASASDKRGVILYRRGALAAYAQPFRVLVDGQPVGFIANASYLQLPLAPGSHQLQIAPGGLAKVTALQIHAETGGSTFYEFVFPTGWDMRPSFEGATIEPRNAQQALEALQGLRSLNAAVEKGIAPNQRLLDD